jgi:carbamoyl-phosphate synthase large subunit
MDAPDEVERLIKTAGFPLVAKPYRSTGSRGMHLLGSRRDLERVRGRARDLVLQEYLLPEDEEYSVSVFSPRHGPPPGAISFRRGPLVAGDTYRATIGPNPDVEAEAIRVVAALRPTGPCNIQLRRTTRGPVTFEVNPRFSGGTAMRAHYGYNDVEMTIRDLVLREPVPIPCMTTGTVLRFWDEMYFDDVAHGATAVTERDLAP